MGWKYRVITMAAAGDDAEAAVNAAAEEGFEVVDLCSAADGAGQIQVSVIMRRGITEKLQSGTFHDQVAREGPGSPADRTN